ncbi:MAG: TrkA C-terminal domain-containing protein, partial [Gammaproteobacteria bacterium]|nr:TrkA C-terminal domain-containing protein [Gammaproteobacteria bacterium]
RVQELRNDNYSPLRQFFHSNEDSDLAKPDETRKQLSSFTLPENAYAIGKTLDELELNKIGVEIHTDHRQNMPPHNTSDDSLLKCGDTLVLFGTPECLQHAEAILLNGYS